MGYSQIKMPKGSGLLPLLVERGPKLAKCLFPVVQEEMASSFLLEPERSALVGNSSI